MMENNRPMCRYFIDIKKILNYLKTEELAETEIIEAYGLAEENDNIELASKTVRELKGGNDIRTISYDIIKSCISVVLSGGEGAAFDIAFNTLLSEGFIREYKSE